MRFRVYLPMKCLRGNFLLFLFGTILPVSAAPDVAPPVETDEYAFIENIPYRDGKKPGDENQGRERCLIDLYHPKKVEKFATVIWIHGGGLKGGKKEIPKPLREQGIAVAAINYRLSPDVKCPVYIEDAAAAVAWTFRHIESYGGDPKLIFLAGHSAGGYLTSMVGLDKSYLAAHGVDADDIAALYPLSGQAITHSTIRAERGIPRSRTVVDQFAPVYHVRPDAPPMMLTTGGRSEDMAARWEENLYLARMMKVAGHRKTTLHELKGHNHGSMVSPALELVLESIRKTISDRQ